MIVFEASVLVSAAVGSGSVPERTMQHAFALDLAAVSKSMKTELPNILSRPPLSLLPIRSRAIRCSRSFHPPEPLPNRLLRSVT